MLVSFARVGLEALFALTLGTAGVGKLLSPIPAAQWLRGITRQRWAAGQLRPVVKGLGLIELMLGGLLLLTIYEFLVAILVMILFSGFVAMVFLGQRTSPGASCGCFGFVEPKTNSAQLASAAILMILSGVYLLFTRISSPVLPTNVAVALAIMYAVVFSGLGWRVAMLRQKTAAPVREADRVATFDSAQLKETNPG